MNELHLFAGCGGGILGGLLLGHSPICAVEIDPFCRKLLLQRQRDGFLPRFPIWDDVRTFDGRPWRGKCDILSGGFPCQDISAASKTRSGLRGKRSGLWSEFRRIAGEIQAPHIFLENSPFATTRGLSQILQELSEMGYDAKWGVFSARAAGARHERKRLFLLAHSHRFMGQTRFRNKPQPTENEIPSRDRGRMSRDHVGDWLANRSGILRNADGMANRLDRVRAIGNGQVPKVVENAWRRLSLNS